MNIYKLIVHDNNFKSSYTVQAANIHLAALKAKVLYGKKFNKIGDEVKVSLEPNDIGNHINELLDKFMEI